MMILQVILILPLLWTLNSAVSFGAWERDAMNAGECVIFRLALGLGTLSYLVFGLGMTGTLNPTAIGILIGLVVALAFFNAITQKNKIPGLLTFRQKWGGTSTQWMFAAGGGGLALLMMNRDSLQLRVSR